MQMEGLLPGLIAALVFFHQGSVAWVYGKERFLDLLGTTASSFFLRSTLATIMFGLVALFLLRVS